MEMTLDRIKELDRIRDREVSKFLQLGTGYGNPPPLPLWEEYADQLEAMARKWGVPFGEFKTYRALMVYIDAAAQGDCESLPLPEEIAREFGIPLCDFNEYLHAEILKIREALREELDEADLAEKDVLADDWDVEEDFLAEAGHRGLCE